MNNWKKRILENKEQAAALVIAIILLTAMELLGFALAILSQIDVTVAANVVKNEQTAYWAEMGLNMAIDTAVDRSKHPEHGAMTMNQPLQLFSADLRGKKGYSPGTDPYPRYAAWVMWFDVTAPTAGSNANSMFRVYRAWAQGVDEKGLVKRQQAEFVLSSGAAGVKYGRGRKLAAGTYLGR